MTFLITGGAGFIGSNLAEVLSKDNDVLVLDNLHTGSLENLKGLNLKTITRPCKDIPTLSLPKLDGIFHLGIPSSSPMYKNNPLVMGDAINEFILVLETAKSNNCPLVYASSSSVYNGNSHPWSEGMPVKVSDYYAEARYSMERLAQLYSFSLLF